MPQNPLLVRITGKAARRMTNCRGSYPGGPSLRQSSFSEGLADSQTISQTLAGRASWGCQSSCFPSAPLPQLPHQLNDVSDESVKTPDYMSLAARFTLPRSAYVRLLSVKTAAAREFHDSLAKTLAVFADAGNV